MDPLHGWVTEGDCSAPHGGYGFPGYLGWSGRVGEQRAQLQLFLHEATVKLTVIRWDASFLILSTEYRGQVWAVDQVTKQRVPLVLGDIQWHGADHQSRVHTMKLRQTFGGLWAHINLPQGTFQLLQHQPDADELEVVTNYRLDIVWQA